MVKYRFVIKQQDIEKSVFSIEETASGDIIVNFSLPKSSLLHKGGVIRINRRSMTIHSSLSSIPSVKTITNKLFNDNISLRKDYSVFRLPNDKSYIWPVSCDALGANLPSLQSRKVNNKEVHIRLASYDPVKETAFIAILVSDPDHLIPGARGLSSYRLSFSRFSITILYNFGNIRSPHSGFFELITTSPSIITNGVPMVGGRPVAADAFSLDNIEPKLLELFYMLSNAIQIKQNDNAFILSGPRHTQFKRFPDYILNMTPDDLTYGVNPIVGAPRHDPMTRMNSVHKFDNRFSQE